MCSCFVVTCLCALHVYHVRAVSTAFQGRQQWHQPASDQIPQFISHVCQVLLGQLSLEARSFLQVRSGAVSLIVYIHLRVCAGLSCVCLPCWGERMPCCLTACGLPASTAILEVTSVTSAQHTPIAFKLGVYKCVRSACMMPCPRWLPARTTALSMQPSQSIQHCCSSKPLSTRTVASAGCPAPCLLYACSHLQLRAAGHRALGCLFHACCPCGLKGTRVGDW